MNFRILALVFATLCAGVVIGLTAKEQAWLGLLFEYRYYLLAWFVFGLVTLALAGVLGYLALKWWIRRKLNIEGDLDGEDVVIALADKLTNREAIDAPNAQDRLHSLLVNLGLYYVRSVAMQRYFLVIGGAFTALIGIVTVLLLNEQNKKLDEQTVQIRIQSQANTVASLLMEGTRRAALSAEQTALFADIRKEAAQILAQDAEKQSRKCPEEEEDNIPSIFSLYYCWVEYNNFDGGTSELAFVSEDLFQRIRAYGLRAAPYPIAVRKEGATSSIDIKTPLDLQFDLPELSPERGQLLQTLLINKVNIGSMPFEGADLRGANLFRHNLRWANLAKANLSGAFLLRADLKWADLRGADFRGAGLGAADLTAANLSGAVLIGADLGLANLSQANLRGADLRKAKLGSSHLGGANLADANLTMLVLTNAPLSLQTNDHRRRYLSWLQHLLAKSRGLDTARLPIGFGVSCGSKSDDGSLRGTICHDDGGWTITYVDQPEFAPRTGEAETRR